MKMFNVALGLMLILLGAVASDAALAGRGHSGRSAQFGHSGNSARFAHSGSAARFGQRRSHARIGVFFAAPLFAPLYVPPSGYLYAPAPAVSPPMYIERDAARSETPAQPHYWYYCAGSKTYYPYVGECPGGWQQVVPETPPPS